MSESVSLSRVIRRRMYCQRSSCALESVMWHFITFRVSLMSFWIWGCLVCTGATGGLFFGSALGCAYASRLLRSCRRTR